MKKMYSYRNSIKSDKSDELINTYLLRPIASLIVWALYDTPITPNQVTCLSIISGILSAFFYVQGTASAFIVAGLLVTCKDILDSVDGQLARAKQLQSRTGRFLDSIGDFAVDVAVFGSIGWVLNTLNHDWRMLVLAFLGLLGISLRVSYHVFYQVRFLHLQNQYNINRISEEVLQEDKEKGGWELILQRIFQIIYGWQDRLIARVDSWCFEKYSQRSLNAGPQERSIREVAWNSDTAALRMSGFLGFGTELFLLMLCSIINKLELYLYLNLFFMNGILLLCILYRRFFISVRHSAG